MHSPGRPEGVQFAAAKEVCPRPRRAETKPHSVTLAFGACARRPVAAPQGRKASLKRSATVPKCSRTSNEGQNIEHLSRMTDADSKMSATMAGHRQFTNTILRAVRQKGREP